MSDFFEKLCLAAGSSQIKREEPMAKHTTFRTGGPAEYFVSPAGEAELLQIISLCRMEKVPYYILGNGSNLLVSDAGYRGVMIWMGEAFSKIERIGGENGNFRHYRAGAGALLSRIAKEVSEDSMTGFEFAAGIPGTLGGAVVMNAGAYGGEIKDILQSVRILDPDGLIRELPAEELDLGYRHSCIPERGYIVLSAVFALKSGEKEDIQAMMEDLAGRRREKQPLEYPSAGSTFKRPAGYFAGKLIEDAGLRGYRVGGAQVSEKHCGFVINRDHAAAQDIRILCEEVQKKVKESFGVDLETEIRMLGWEE